MSDAINIMLDYFSRTKLAGSYFLLFLVSIVLLYYLHKETNVWLILYGIAILVIFVMNPIIVWALMLVFPALQAYEPITLLVPVLLYVPFAATELIETIKEKRVRYILGLILVLLISICGNTFGFFKDYSITEENKMTKEERNIAGFLDEMEPELVLADQSLIPAINEYGHMIPLFYGRDLYTANMDTGIMDGYNEEAYTFFDVMKSSEENADFIVDTAYEYSCDIIVMSSFEDAPQTLGKYKLAGTTANYLIYALNE